MIPIPFVGFGSGSIGGILAVIAFLSCNWIKYTPKKGSYNVYYGGLSAGCFKKDNKYYCSKELAYMFTASFTKPILEPPELFISQIDYKADQRHPESESFTQAGEFFFVIDKDLFKYKDYSKVNTSATTLILMGIIGMFGSSFGKLAGMFMPGGNMIISMFSICSTSFLTLGTLISAYYIFSDISTFHGLSVDAGFILMICAILLAGGGSGAGFMKQ